MWYFPSSFPYLGQALPKRARTVLSPLVAGEMVVAGSWPQTRLWQEGEIKKDEIQVRGGKIQEDEDRRMKYRRIHKDTIQDNKIKDHHEGS